MRRRLVPLAVAVGLSVGLAAPAALADDLGDYLERAAGAEFHGRGLVLCTWGPDSAGTSYEVTRTGGMSMIHWPAGEAMLVEGRTALRTGEDWYGMEIGEWGAWRISERYALTEPEATTRLGRPARAITVLEEGLPRARMVIDEESTVPLLTEVLDGDGGVFRTAVLIEFAPGPHPMPGSMPEMHEMGVVTRASETGDLPDQVAGYRRADVYVGDEGTMQAFYTDGLFSFSVFEARRGRTPAAFEGATRFEVGGETYRRIVKPSEMWVHWNAPDRSYVLVGDLPPDHLTTILGGMPEPGDRALLVRLWRRLFG
jgi:hypothetical protein